MLLLPHFTEEELRAASGQEVMSSDLEFPSESKSLVLIPHHAVTLKWLLYAYPFTKQAFIEHGVQSLRYMPGTGMSVTYSLPSVG